jgi:hypothetical protein
MAKKSDVHMDAGQGALCRAPGVAQGAIGAVTCPECLWITTAVLTNNLAEALARLRVVTDANKVTVINPPTAPRAA